MNTAFDSLISANPQIKRVLKENLTFAVAPSENIGIQFARKVLSGVVDSKTILLLSGGRTPKELYSSIAEEGELILGIVGLIDERYGAPMHEGSNELMIKKTNLLSYLEKRNIPFHPILQQNTSREETAKKYDQDLRSLFATFPKSIGILGIGLDGHTAGIPVQAHHEVAPTKYTNVHDEFAIDFDNFPGEQKERISMTFLGLWMLDVILVLVFGEDKKEAIEKMLSDGDEEEIPARFFKREDIAQKTLFITDQNV